MAASLQSGPDSGRPAERGRSAAPENARCRHCGYLLRGLPECRCPECGHAFDPDDPATMDLGRRIGPVARWWLQPAGKPLNICAAGNALLMLVSAIPPGGCFELLMISGRIGLLIGGIWLLRLAVSAALAWYYRQPTLRRGQTWLRWLIVPAIVTATVCLLQYRVPLHLGFWLSRPAMDRLAREVMNSPDTAPGSIRVGLYYATDIQAFPGGIRFIVDGAGFLARRGFAYSPTAPPPNLGEDRYEPISGPWYTWIEIW